MTKLPLFSSCGCSIPRDIKGQDGCSPELFHLAGNNTPHSRWDWNQMIFNVPSKPNHSLFLWFYDQSLWPTENRILLVSTFIPKFKLLILFIKMASVPPAWFHIFHSCLSTLAAEGTTFTNYYYYFTYTTLNSSIANYMISCNTSM